MSEKPENPCMDCGGSCCTMLRSGICYIKLDRGERYDYALKRNDCSTLLTDNGKIVNMNWYILTYNSGMRLLTFDCSNLSVDGKCTIYEDRPSMCRNFSCEYLDGEITWDEHNQRFRKPEEDKYRDDMDAHREGTKDITEVTDRVNEILKEDLGAELQ